jgi:toxin ParE1/3/4
VTKPVRLDNEAEQELGQAMLWLQAQRRGLGGELLAEIDEALVRLARAPKSFPRALGAAPELGVRRIHVRRFPYALVFVEGEHEIRVLAVAHHRRRSGYWRRRLST